MRKETFAYNSRQLVGGILCNAVYLVLVYNVDVIEPDSECVHSVKF